MNEEIGPLAARIEALFQRRWPDGYRGSNSIVAEFVSREVGQRIDRQMIYRLRTGKVRKVDVPVLEAIAKYFDDSLDYFSGIAQESAHGVELDDVLRETGFNLAGLRSRGPLTEDSRRELARLLREARQIIDADKQRSQ